MGELKIIVADNFKDFGERINKHLNTIRKTNTNYLVDTSLVRFNNGEGKCVINNSIRDADLYILSDVSNYDIGYMYHGKMHYMGPDEHFQDIKRILSAESGHATKRTLIMPYLYESRQDKKDSRESLDCAIALQELARMGVNEIITCDVHNKAILNAIPRMASENVYLNDAMILKMLETEKINCFDDIICVAPDEGALKRARFFSEILGNVQVGSFYKQRDYTKIVNGKNPIVAHDFLGPKDLSGKCAVVVDDMIASGGSILDTARLLKQLGSEKIILMVTFALFTEGVEKFDEYYQAGIIDKVYASNVAYVPQEIMNKEWFESVDCSLKLAYLINEIHSSRSIGDLINYKEDVAVKIRSLRKERKY